MDGNDRTNVTETSQADQEPEDNFKPMFKKYKRRDKPLDLSDVIDLEKMTPASNLSVKRVKPIVPALTPIVGLRPVQDWSIFHFVHHTGFYVIRNPFLPGSQRFWTSRCLQDLPRPPQVTNLALHPDLNAHTLWYSFLADFRHRGSEAYSKSCSVRKLRWTTIGYHYHWEDKRYAEEDHSPFPPDIGVLTYYVACVLGFPTFQAEAGIINYYHHDSTLSPHTDHSELDHDAPLLSVSFGQDAIFLMGGLTKAQTPTAIRLHSGDICVMSDESRLAFHAVPRILPSPSSSPPSCFDMTADDWQRLNSSVGDVGGTPGCGGDAPRCGGDISQCDQSCPCCEGEMRQCGGAVPGDDGDTRDHLGDSCDHARDAQRASSENVWPKAARESSVTTVTTTQHAQGAQPRHRKDSSRVRYEGVVKEVNRQIIHSLQEQDWAPFAAYLASSRLNLNIRQVLKAGHTFHSASTSTLARC